ncbi:MAG: ferritin-like domain-containing protein [Pirellulales bacterium]
MSVKSLDDLFLDELKDTLDAEKQILKALPKMIKAAESEELKSAFEEHLGVTEEHVNRLESVFEMLDKAARGKHCTAMEGLLKEGAELIEEIEEGPTRDAAMIGAAQKVEHYEIAAYGTLVAYAKLLGMDNAVDVLHSTLVEEKEADEKLTDVASEINVVAQEQGAE